MRKELNSQGVWSQGEPAPRGPPPRARYSPAALSPRGNSKKEKNPENSVPLRREIPQKGRQDP